MSVNQLDALMTGTQVLSSWYARDVNRDRNLKIWIQIRVYTTASHAAISSAAATDVTRTRIQTS